VPEEVLLDQLEEQKALVETFQERHNAEHQRAITAEFQVKRLTARNQRLETALAEAQAQIPVEEKKED